jgi:hypothetical protein
VKLLRGQVKGTLERPDYQFSVQMVFMHQIIDDTTSSKLYLLVLDRYQTCLPKWKTCDASGLMGRKTLKLSLKKILKKLSSVKAYLYR